MKNLAKMLQSTDEEPEKLGADVLRLGSLRGKKRKPKQIKEIIEGLKKTEENHRKEAYYPGKYDTAYYFVEKIEQGNYIRSRDFKPGLMAECPQCKSHVPVLMSYKQTYDSPEGDEWTRTVFTICCNNINIVDKRVSS